MSTAPQTVLFVDDDRAILAAYRRAFEAAAGRALLASCSREARVLSEQRLDGCVLDYQLGRGESGLALVPALRSQHPDAIIVLITAHGHFELGATAIKAGADHALAKPVSFSTILTCLRGDARRGDANRPAVASDERARWDHMRRVLAECDGNRSEAARQLRIDRGTLQRWLDRPAPK